MRRTDLELGEPEPSDVGRVCVSLYFDLHNESLTGSLADHLGNSSSRRWPIELVFTWQSAEIQLTTPPIRPAFLPGLWSPAMA